MGKSAIPEGWTIGGLVGPYKGDSVESLSRVVAGVTYNLSLFPKVLTPSPLLPTYTDKASIDVLARFEAALLYIVGKCAEYAPCNTYFTSLSKGLSLKELLGWQVRIHYWKPASSDGSPNPAGDVASAEQLASGQNDRGENWTKIAIGEDCLAGDIKLAATLVHELAHVAGALGATADDRARLGKQRKGAEYDRLIAAEMALKQCLLPKQFNPDAIGLLHDRGPAWRGQGGRRIV
ncbi:MAG: hypothetical protein NTW56_10340 [Alphaproteobacteria bacterium]|nr:hypothetical protein [Alphaproteobacteria bacterium]